MTPDRHVHLVFRTATARDAASIVALVQSTYRGDASRRGWTTEADLLDGQRTDLDEVLGLVARPGDLARVVLAERDSDLVACGHLERQGSAAYFGMFSVDPTIQGGGVGRRVLAEAERVARADWGCLEMRMNVIDVRHELVAWYERRGYARTGEHKPFPYGDARFGLPKRDDLRFEVLRKAL